MTMENLEELRDRLLREEHVQKMVRMRAYEIYQMRGGVPGWESHDWFQAEGEVLAFLIAHESPREDDLSVIETTNEMPPTKTPSVNEASVISKTTPKKASLSKAPKTGSSARASTAKTAKTSASKDAKQETSRKSESRPKSSRTRKSAKKEKSDQ